MIHLLSLVLLLLTRGVHSATVNRYPQQPPRFVGCTASVVSQLATFTLSNTYGRTEELAGYCAVTCGDNGYEYSYWQLIPSTYQCKCSNTAPVSTVLSQTSEAYQVGTTPACLATNAYNIWLTRSNYNIVRCSNTTITTDLASQGTKSSVLECLQACSNFVHDSGVSVTPLPAAQGGGYECSCTRQAGESIAYSSEKVCEIGTAMIYKTVDNQVLPSGYARRALKEKLKKARTVGLCPEGFEACKIGDSPEGYECIDTFSDLESCGGCTSGKFETGQVSGTDCTTLPGIADYGVTCFKGSCQAFACEEGWTLASNQTCIAP
ncbi:hypothetical protein V865_007609 [Kwoniella europaea PYCC6329]|uniref:Protein CPL1-like domain-containing protein n=1 Tax=Kwoniella europaea PYCC6329 TaxID=1423913 RepID=A0AAX4KSU0_9TREE